MRFGIWAAIRKFASGTKDQQEAAKELRALEERKAPLEDYLALLESLQRSSIFPESVWLCLITDLVEETAEKAAEEEIGTDDEFDMNYRDLKDNLADRLKEVIGEFLGQTPMPINYVFWAIESMTDDIKEGYLDQNKLVKPYNNQHSAIAAKLMPKKLQDAGCHQFAKLYEEDPRAFQSMKHDGERWLLGMTYDEERQESVRHFFGDSQT